MTTRSSPIHPLSIFYSKQQSVSPDVFVSADSPSAHKPALVVAEAVNRFSNRIVLAESAPLTREDIALAHSRIYVDDVLDCMEPNGFGNTSSEVAAALPWTVGSFYSAAKFALAHQTMAMSPTSGFHHACFDRAMGFCTFNGLMVAAIKLLQERVTRDVLNIGIIDFDAHYGNGTEDIIEKLGLRGKITHETFGKYAIKDTSYRHWLNSLPWYLESKFALCGLLFYQAGADPHLEDPYGGFLSTDEMLERDRIVFRTANKLRIPIVWNLAGGYQAPVHKVIDLHMNTFQAAFENQF